MDAPIPRYRDLPRADPIEAGHAWDVWGRDDELGRLNLMTPATVLAAAAEVRRGHVFNLGHGVLPETDTGLLGRLVEFVHEETARANSTRVAPELAVAE